MKLVLNKSIKRFCSFAVLIIIIAALLKYICDFLISTALARAYFSYTLKQLVKIIFAELTSILQHIVV